VVGHAASSLPFLAVLPAHFGRDADDQLQSSCSTPVPKSPVARLEMVEAELNAVADAIRIIRPNLKNFYASLNDDQKAKFNMMRPREN
jgi:hypothetical protein